MVTKNLKKIRRLKIRKRVRRDISGTTARPRLSVYKSNTAIYAQLIDDEHGNTLMAASAKKLNLKVGANIEAAKQVGQALAADALAKGIETVVFDRSGYLYHGRVKALADAARAGGLKF
jgi:large subunit ribosomal protein L18